MSTPKHLNESQSWSELDEKRLEHAVWIALGIRPSSLVPVMCSWALGHRRFNQIKRHCRMSSFTVARALKVLTAQGILSKDANGSYATGPLFWSYRCPRRGTYEDDREYIESQIDDPDDPSSQNISSAN